jgi:hypothetical protein
LFWCVAVAAQTRHFIDPWTDLTHSLRNAPLSETERADIYRVVDETAHDSFPESERAKERDTVLSAPVADVMVTAKGPAQVLVRSPELFCGAANCTLWLFLRESGHLRQILETSGTGLEIRNVTSHGFHDLVAGSHMSAFEQDYTLYRWDGRKYGPIDSYACRFNRESADRPLSDVRCRP